MNNGILPQNKHSKVEFFKVQSQKSNIKPSANQMY